MEHQSSKFLDWVEQREGPELRQRCAEIAEKSRGKLSEVAILQKAKAEKVGGYQEIVFDSDCEF